MNRKYIIGPFLAISLLFSVPMAAFAHVSVKPAEVGVGAFQTFVVGVPNERESNTVAVRLVLPQGLEHVSPNVKPGWTISTKHAEAPAESTASDHQHAEGPVTEISWTGGTIPAGQRDDFLFSAKAPTGETTLQWKAYQTYADGTVVAWELDPKAEQPKDASGNPDFSKSGPLSETKVTNDLATSDDSETAVVASSTDKSVTYAAYGALLLSATALAVALKDKIRKPTQS